MKLEDLTRNKGVKIWEERLLFSNVENCDLSDVVIRQYRVGEVRVMIFQELLTIHDF